MGTQLVSDAAERVRAGDVDYFRSADREVLEKVCKGKDSDGRSCLHTAAACAQAEIFEVVLAVNPDAVRQADEDGWTPLMSASSSGHDGMVARLLASGAPVDASNSTKRTALHYAASKARLRVAQLLTEAGADVNAQDKFGASPLHRACSAVAMALVEFLVATAGASLTCRDCEGNTPLHTAVAVATDKESAQPAFFLARHGAALDATNKAEETPLTLAGENASALQAAAADALDEY